MIPSIGGGLLAASMLLGQATGQPTNVQVIQQPGGKTVYYQTGAGQTQAQTQPQRPFMSWFQREDRPIISKLQSWFGRKDPQQQQEPPLQTPYYQPRGTTTIQGAPTLPANYPGNTTPTDFPRKMPSPSSQPLPKQPSGVTGASASKPVQQTNMQMPIGNMKSPILPQFANKMGRDEKFEWITGQLEMENGKFMLYYATPETVDKLQGRIVLMPQQQTNMNQFRRGDLISVRGNIVQRQGGVPAYIITEANLIERPK